MNSNNTERSLQEQFVALEQDTASEDLFRLAQARNNALQQKPRTISKALWPAMATAFGSAILIAVLYSPTDSLLSPNTEFSSDDYYSELSDDNFELYDDLEFYDWLADIET
tara:strand:+ start:56 stop:388 length:333 start_codon:yes stop_codon:yes gene_type:complete